MPPICFFGLLDDPHSPFHLDDSRRFFSSAGHGMLNHRKVTFDELRPIIAAASGAGRKEASKSRAIFDLRPP